MPRRSQPNRVIDRFREDVDDSIQTLRALSTTPLSRRVRERLAVDGFFRTAVSFEQFQSDWIISAINRDPSALHSWRNAWERLRQRAPPPRPDDNVTLADLDELIAWHVANPNLGTTRRLVDPEEVNVTFEKLEILRRRGEFDLGPSYRALLDRVLATPRYARVLRVTTAVRNCIAHRSRRATKAMYTALSRSPELRTRQTITFVGLGRFLLARAAPTQSSRFEVLHLLLGEIAEALRVSSDRIGPS
jgi:hypothetical protein